MQFRRGHIYGIRTCLPEFVNACISSSSGLPSSFSRGQLVNTTIRPCVLVSWTPTVCHIALLATFGNASPEQISTPELRHFSIPISHLSPRHGLATVDKNRVQATPLTHQYVVACIGSVRIDELCEWIDSGRQNTLDEGAVRRLEAIASERLLTWEQVQRQGLCTGLQSQMPIPNTFSHLTLGQVSA